MVMGRSAGGLLAQMLAGQGLAAATVAIDPGVFRGVLPLPLSVLKSSGPFLINPLNRRRAITFTFKQFNYGWANALERRRRKSSTTRSTVAGSGIALAQMGNANLSPWTQAKVNTKNPDRGPLLIIEGENDQHGAMGDRPRRLQAAAAQPRRDGDREDPEPGSRPHDRPRLARGRPGGARLRQAVHRPPQPRRNTPGRRLTTATYLPNSAVRAHPVRSRRVHRGPHGPSRRGGTSSAGTREARR